MRRAQRMKSFQLLTVGGATWFLGPRNRGFPLRQQGVLTPCNRSISCARADAEISTARRRLLEHDFSVDRYLEANRGWPDWPLGDPAYD